MKNLLILGAGTSGTMMANHLVSKLPKKEWQITIVDQYKTHYYQPGFLFLPFDIYTSKQVKKNGKKFIPKAVNYIQEEIEIIRPESNAVDLKNGEVLPYDILIIATGCKIAPDEIEGMDGPNWHKNIFDFYTYSGAVALSKFLKFWKGGKLVLNVAEMPIKCPVAPLEFMFLADWYFHERGIRDDVELIFSTPLPSSPIGSGGTISTCFSPSVASPRSTMSWNRTHSSRRRSRISSSGTLATRRPWT